MDSKELNEGNNALATEELDPLLSEKKPASTGKGVAFLALFVALAAAGASGWQWWQAYQADPVQATQEESLTRLQDSQQQVSQSLTSLESQLKSIESNMGSAEFARRGDQLKAIESQFAELRSQSGADEVSIDAVQSGVRSLEQRLSTTESGLAGLAARNRNSSAELAVAEIDFLLRAASDRLHLLSDPAAAAIALHAADVQLAALNDPMFLSVRQRIAAALQTLAAVPLVDHVLLSARLTDMQSKVSALPFRGEVESTPEADLADDAGWWESIKQTLSSLVTVKRRVPEDQSLLSLDDKDYLRQGLWLQLESARLALMRSDTAAYVDSLDRVGVTVTQFFKNDASEVKAVLDEVDALGQVIIAPDMPDISAPWTQLRQLRDSRSLMQAAPPVELVEPVDAVESGDPVE